MTTIRALIQSSPARANDLFAKLVDTSDTAVKTRDRLLAELKVELELQAGLEEQHLFPVLKKHEETKGLVADALNDNRQTRALLGELEATPTDSEAFGAKVAELRAVFQRHVRDERKEFLPAIVKALSAEEASSIVEKIEDGKARVEAEQRAEAEQRRAEAKREREQAESVTIARDKAAAARRARKDARDAKDAKDKATAAAKDKAAAAEKASAVARDKAVAAKDKAAAAAKDKAAAAARDKDIEARRVEAAQRDAADAEARAAALAKAGAKAARQGAEVMRMALGAEAGTVVEMRKSIRDKAANGARAEASGSNGATSLAALFDEQARHAMDAAMALGGAKTLAEAARAQGDFITGSYKRMKQFNERYLAFVSGGMATGLMPSLRR